MLKLQRFATLFVAIFVTLWTPSLLPAEEASITGEIFGTTYSVRVRTSQEIDASTLQQRIAGRLKEIDQRMSTYRKDSDLSRFNSAEADEWFSVSEETMRVVRHALELSAKTGGAFDVTVGPAVGLWNFGADANGTFVVPTQEQLDEVRDMIGFSKLEYRVDPPALKKSVAGLRIDLSAIAKGYAVDEVCRLLIDMDAYLVEIGGEIRVKGSHLDGSGWRIGLELPTRLERRVDSIVSLHNEAMATSGDYRNYHELDGVTYSHTIDPATSRPVTHGVASVTVLADDCATADALATALLVMGREAGKIWAEANSVRALFVERNHDAFQRTGTIGFPELEILSEPASTPAGENSGYVRIFFATVVVFGIALLAMSLGTIIANRRIQGSCGGMAGMKDASGKTICDMCTRPSPECLGEASSAELNNQQSRG